MSDNVIRNSAEEFATELNKLLKNNNFEEASNLFKRGDHIIQSYSWDIVPVVSSYLTAKNKKHNKKLFDYCVSLLETIAEKCSPIETILELLEQIEYDENDDVKFCAILKPLSISLVEIGNIEKAIEWCISTIKSYVQSLPLLENEKPEVIEENVCSKDNSIVSRLINIQKAIVTFLEPLVKDVALTKMDVNESLIVRYHLSSLLIYLLGKPFCYLGEQCHDSKVLSENMVSFVFQIFGDPLSFLSIIHERSKKRSRQTKTNNENETYRNLRGTLFESNESIPTLSYANFYFYTITRESIWAEVPQVYNLFYILEVYMYLSRYLIEQQKYILVERGLDTMRAALKRIGSQAMNSKMITSKIYMEMFDVVSNQLIYNDSSKIRKKALATYQEYIEIFDMQARYSVFSQLYKTTEHSGLLSFIIGMLKSSIIECIDIDPPCPYFVGDNLTSLVEQICMLPHGSATELVVMSDEIISALNLLRFLFLRDRRNETGIWNIVDRLDTKYLKPLREAINLCKLHWDVKLKDLKDHEKILNKSGKSIDANKIDEEITLMVGGQKVPPMPITEKIKFCYQVLSGLDVMESVLVRVNECLADNPVK